MKELVVLVADGQQKAVIETLIEARYQSLFIRQLRNQQDFDVFAHPRKDPGVYGEAAQFLSIYVSEYRYALVLLDAEWEGSPGSSVIQQKIQIALNHNGWENRSETIVIEPELEIWVWSSSSEVCNILGQTWEQIHQIAEQRHLWTAGAEKPQRPKELMEVVLHQARKHPSAAIFNSLAKKVSLTRCQDVAFEELKQKLQEWFPSA